MERDVDLHFAWAWAIAATVAARLFDKISFFSQSRADAPTRPKGRAIERHDEL